MSDMKIRYFVIPIVILSCVFLQNSYGQGNIDTASFLKIGSSARAIALGSAFVAVADDPSAGYWNPAGLAQLQGPAILVADRVLAMDTNYANFSISSPLWSYGSIGLNAIYYGCNNIPAYDSNGLSKGEITDMETALIVSYAYRIDQLLLGVNAKYIYQDMSGDDVESSKFDGFGADMAILYRVYHNLSVGAIFHSKYNLSSGDSATSDESPLNVCAGINYRQNLNKDNNINFMLDFDQTKSYPLKLHFGMELSLYDFFMIRAGLDDIYAEKMKTYIDYMDLLKYNVKPTFGLGFKWKWGKYGASPASDARRSALTFDYALSIEKLGLKNFFTLGYQF
jgi:hypothetical protein